jgi:hypothetical protein
MEEHRRGRCGVTGILRTVLGGSDGLNLEWWDDEYNKELEARWRAADAETPRTGRARLTDWEEAARQPRKTRLFLTASFTVLGVIFATLAGDLTPWSLAVGAALGAVTGAAIGEYAMRSLRGRERPKDAH